MILYPNILRLPDRERKECPDYSPTYIQYNAEHKFIDYISSLTKDKFIYEDVDVLRLEDLFAKLKKLRTYKAAKVLIWEQGVVFAGFADGSCTPFGEVVVMNATSLDECMKLLFKKGGVRWISQGQDTPPTPYKPDVIRENLDILGSPSEYVKKLKEKNIISPSEYMKRLEEQKEHQVRTDYIPDNDNIFIEYPIKVL